MGIYDRDYYRNAPRGGFGSFSFISVTTWIVIINVGLFVVDGFAKRAMEPDVAPGELSDETRPLPPAVLYTLTMGPLERFGYFSIDTAIRHAQVWRVLTFQLLHASPIHLVYNMLALLLFGPIIEGHFGPRRYAGYYLLCGFAGAAMYVLLWACHVLVTDPTVPLVSASAGIFGVLLGAAKFAPDMEVPLAIFPTRVVVLAWVALAVAVLIVLSGGPNAGGEAAHIGGAVCGAALLHNQHWLNLIVPSRKQSVPRRSRHRPNRVQKDWSKDLNR